MLILRFQLRAVVKRLQVTLSPAEADLWTKLVDNSVILSPVNNFDETSVNLKHLRILTAEWSGALESFKLVAGFQLRGMNEDPAAVRALGQTLSEFTELRLWTSARGKHPAPAMDAEERLTKSLFLSIFIFCAAQSLEVRPIAINGVDIKHFCPHASRGVKPEELSLCNTTEVLIPVFHADQFFKGWKSVALCAWTPSVKYPVPVVAF